ncbi:MAG: Carboxymuconolactone decarboxylase family protein [Methanobacterium sp. PtaB.Bin024]|jgi:AhpD family alkylhydroperoxidase|nr:MAG: Carboxymuconolactone decarboxylase family protein [Methanobacterium sp. PtaB.Bin024]
MEQNTKPKRFTEAIGEDVDSAFTKLASEILKDGALSLKEKSLIAVACAIAVSCDNCTKVHQKQAIKLGATHEEILEAAAVAGLVRMGSGFNTAYLLLDNQHQRKNIPFKKITEEKQHNNQPDLDETQQMKPDGYLNNLLEKNSSHNIPKR